jgi:hypothetical protein
MKPDSRELIQKVPKTLRNEIERSIFQKMWGLEQDLDEFLQQAKRGGRAGTGILGRAAEYLVAQRGIES